MSNTNTAPMNNNNIQVHITTNYSLFKPINGNRNKNVLHINRLLKSIKENYLFTVIIVNENYEIIDGQHRFDVIKELKLPLYYIIREGYGLNEVHILNQNSKNWSSDDYLEGYCELGKEHYIEYRKFKDKFGFGHKECMTLLGGSDSGYDVKEFWSGNFKIKSLKQAYDNAIKISMNAKYYDGYKRTSFVRVLNSLLNNPKFDFTHFMQKLQIQPSALKDCNNAEQYKLIIEDIYNYRTREKVNLRY